MNEPTAAERLQELWTAFANAYDPAVWGLPLTVMLIGIIGGVVVSILAFRANERRTVEAEGRRLDLLRSRDTVVDAIRALDLERDKLSPEDYERERKALLAHGAQAMRALEEDPVSDDSNEILAAVEQQREALGDERADLIKGLLTGAPLPTAESTPAPAEARRAAISPQWQGALITLGVVGVLGALYLVLTGVEATNDRNGVNAAAAQRSAPPQRREVPVTEAEKTWAATLESNPDDLDALNGLTDYEIRRQRWDSAIGYNDRALAVDPRNPEARTWKALLVYRTGAYPEATRQLDAVIADHPDYARGHQFRGMIHLQLKELEPALARFERALELATEDSQRGGLRALIAETKQAMNAGKPELAGTVTLAEGVDPSAWGPSAQVYVSVKAANGPPRPLRAKRLPNGPYPLTFSIASTDSPMGGGPLPADISVTVKVDLDGNPMGDDPGAPKLVVGDVQPGSLDLNLVLGGS